MEEYDTEDSKYVRLSQHKRWLKILANALFSLIFESCSAAIQHRVGRKSLGIFSETGFGEEKKKVAAQPLKRSQSLAADNWDPGIASLKAGSSKH